MSARVKCPGCQAVIQIQDDQVDSPFKCSSCGRPLRLSRRAPTADSPAQKPDSPAPKPETPPKSKGSESKKDDPVFSPILSDFLFDKDKKKTSPSDRSRRDDDDENERGEDDAPRNSRRRNRRDEDDRDEDDEDDRHDRRSSSAKRSGKQGRKHGQAKGNSNLLIAGLVAGALLVIGGGIGIYYAVKGPSKDKKTEVAQNNDPVPEKKEPADKKEPAKPKGDGNPKKDGVDPKKEEPKKEPVKGGPLDQGKLAQLGRAATAFVDVTQLRGRASGTAFCIHPAGYFVTNYHVAQDARQIKLVQYPNTPKERAFPAKVFRADGLNDLVVLKAEGAPNDLDVLKIGDSSKVAELQSLVAFGFPFGDKLALEKGYPAISVNPIKVSSLRDRAGELYRIQLDGALNPGHSGGPVLDQDGKVVGVVVSGIVGSGSAMAIPSAIVENFVHTPTVSLAPPALMEKDRGKEVTISATVDALFPEDSLGRLELTFQVARQVVETVEMEAVGGLYRAKVKIPADVAFTTPMTFTASFKRNGREVTSAQASSRFRSDDGVVAKPKDPGPGPDPGPEPKQGLAGQEVKLPNNFEAVCLGGSGRFVVLNLARERKVAVLDVAESKIAKYIPTPEDNVLVAASHDKLVIVGVANRTIQRWSLTTFEKELTLPLPVNAAPIMALMGHASYGPLLIRAGEQRIGSGSMTFIDLKTLKSLDIERDKNEVGGLVDGDIGRVSADGKTFGFWRRGTSPSGFITVVLGGSSFKSYYQHESPGHIAPNADGSTIHTSIGGYSVEGKPLEPGEENRRNRRFEIPAVDKGYFLVAEFDGAPFPDRAPGGLNLHMSGNRKSLIAVKGVKVPAGINQWAREKIGYDQRILLFARQKRIVVLPETNDRAVVYDFDVENALEQSGADYLIVTSDPVKVAAKGMLYRYPVQVKSKQGQVKISIDAGPTGMALDKDNNLIWPVPESPPDDVVDVILSVTDKSGQQELHSYRIAVKDKKDVPGAQPIPPELLAKLPKQDPKVETPPAKEEKLTQDKLELKLPGAIDSLCFGGGGRYLILHMPRENKLAVFDAASLKIVKYLPAAEDGLVMAASRDKLIVGLPKARALQRWSLKTFEKEVTSPLQTKGELRALAMGHDSDGPLLLLTSTGDRSVSGGFSFHNPTTFRELDLKVDAGEGRNATAPSLGTAFASADGKVFAVYNTDGRDFRTFVVQATTIKFHQGGQILGPALPSADGKALFTSDGPCSVEGKPLNDKKGPMDFVSPSLQLPAVQGNYFLDVQMERDRNNPTQSSISRIGIHLGGQKTPLVSLRDVAIAAPRLGEQSKFGLHLRLLYLPNHSMLITIPATNNMLVLHKVDLDQLLEKSGIDYLIVTSSPLTTAAKSKDYAYALRVKSKKGGVTFKLDSGPEGMAIDKDGKLTWKVPASFSEKQADVLITVSDKSGQETFHSFKVEVGDK